MTRWAEISRGAPGRRKRRTGIVASIALALAATFPIEAFATCCELIKVDPDTPPATIQACAGGAGEACGTLLFVGTLALGESAEVCSTGDTILYSEFDDEIQQFGPFTQALCVGQVEL